MHAYPDLTIHAKVLLSALTILCGAAVALQGSPER
jgi:hypothetical protein